ncbi:MAG: hypothetical protein ACI8TQ_001325 [Planctomycetota bacterium]|jgi:hypothetical protein
MKPKSLIILLILTTIVVVAALDSLREPKTTSAEATAGNGAFLEGLLDSINDVARIEVNSGGESLVATKSDDTWILESSGGYPAKFEIVKATLISLAGLKRAEGKTSNPESYSILGVAAPAAGPDSSMQVTLSDASGTKLAAIILGNRKGSRAPQLFVRQAAAAQAWLVDGQVKIEMDPGFWMEKQFANITQDRIASVVINREGEPKLAIHKDRPTDTNFVVEDVPADRELIAESIANSIAAGLGFLSLEEVRPVGQIDFESGKVSQATFRTWDGLVVSVDTTLIDGEGWIRLTASADARPTILPEVVEEGAEPVEPTEFEGATAEEIATEVAELNSALGTWAYRVPSYKLSSFEKRISELLREPVVEEPVSTDPAPTGFDPYSMESDGESAADLNSFESLMNASEEELDGLESSDG